MRTFSRTPLMQQAPADNQLYASPSRYSSDSTSSFASKSQYRADITTALTPTAKNQSDSAAAVSSHANMRTDSGEAIKSYWGEKSPMWGRNVSFTASATGKDVPEVSSGSGYGDTREKHADDAVQGTVSKSVVTTYSDSVADIWNSPSAQMPYEAESALPVTAHAPSKPQAYQSPYVYSRESRRAAVPSVPDTGDQDIWKPLTPYLTYPAVPNSTAMSKVYAPFASKSAGRADAVVPPRAQTGNSSINWNQNEKNTYDRQDPNAYLYSYMKDQGDSRSSVAAYSRDKTNIWLPSAAFQDDGYNAFDATAANTKDSANIWKQNSSFANRRPYQRTSRSYYSAASNGADNTKSANAKVRKFVWSENGQWE